MNLKEAMKRIEELEALVRILAARPIEVHHHNDFAGPHTPVPTQPVYTPGWPIPTITCGSQQ